MKIGSGDTKCQQAPLRITFFGCHQGNQTMDSSWFMSFLSKISCTSFWEPWPHPEMNITFCRREKLLADTKKTARSRELFQTCNHKNAVAVVALASLSADVWRYQKRETIAMIISSTTRKMLCDDDKVLDLRPSSLSLPFSQGLRSLTFVQPNNRGKENLYLKKLMLLV